MNKHLHLPTSTHIVLFLLAGICWPSHIGICISLVAVIVFYFYTNTPKNISRSLLFAVTCIFAGYFLHKKQVTSFVDFQEVIAKNEVCAVGTVTDYSYTKSGNFPHKLEMWVDRFLDAGKVIAQKKYICIYTKWRPPVRVGTKIFIRSLKFKKNNKNDFGSFLIKNNIAASVFIVKLDFKKEKQQDTFSFLNSRQTILKNICKKMSYPASTAFNSIFLGNKSWHKKEYSKLRNNFQTWGVIHYLARSGLHLVLIAMMWGVIGSLLGLPFLLNELISILFILIYFLLSWSAIPFVRALIMIFSYKACTALKLQPHTLHILNLSCIFTLITNPISVFFLDFQLSFGLTYGLVLLGIIIRMKNLSKAKTLY